MDYELRLIQENMTNCLHDKNVQMIGISNFKIVPQLSTLMTKVSNLHIYSMVVGVQ